jgi:hypothetical protein
VGQVAGETPLYLFDLILFFLSILAQAARKFLFKLKFFQPELLYLLSCLDQLDALGGKNDFIHLPAKG